MATKVATIGAKPAYTLKRQQKAVEILQRLAASGGIIPGIDPLDWQREERKDRPLPGRED